PGVEVVAVTTVTGNTDAAQAARNVAKVLEAAGRSDIPVVAGTTERVGAAPDLGHRSPHIHGTDGLGDAGIPEATTVTFLDERAPDCIARLAGARPGRLTLVPIGPFTNVARALEADGDLAAN